MSARNTPDLLAPREWAIYRHACRRGTFSVGDLLVDLEADADPLAHNTVVTLLERLIAKGHVRRLERQGRGFAYEIAIPFKDAVRAQTDHFLTNLLRDDPIALAVVRAELKARLKRD